MPAVPFLPLTQDKEGNQVPWTLPNKLIKVIEDAVSANQAAIMEHIRLNNGENPMTFKPEYHYEDTNINHNGVTVPENGSVWIPIASIENGFAVPGHDDLYQQMIKELAQGGVYPRLGGKNWSGVAQKAKMAQDYFSARAVWDATWGSELGSYIRSFGEPDLITWYDGGYDKSTAKLILQYTDEPFRVQAMMGEGNVLDESPDK